MTEIVTNLYKQVLELRKIRITELVDRGETEDALSVVLKEARKIKKLSLFYLGESQQWIQGIELSGTYRLSAVDTRTREITRISSRGVFDITNGVFRFFGSCEQVNGTVDGSRVTGLELKEPMPEGHERFFTEGTPDQQKKLLFGAFECLLAARMTEVTGKP